MLTTKQAQATHFENSKILLSQKNLRANISDRSSQISLTTDSLGENNPVSIQGNPHLESYRLLTFDNFPKSVAKIVDPEVLAQNGFLYTGYNDSVKCFSCNRYVSTFKLNW